MKSAREPVMRPVRSADVPGLPVRLLAADIIDGVLHRHRALDEILESSNALTALTERDRALVRALVGIVLRRLGTLRRLLAILLGNP